MNSSKIKVAILFLILTSTQVIATHLRGGLIQFQTMSNNMLSQRITVLLIADTQSAVSPGHGEISFGDGTTLVLVDNASSHETTALDEESLLHTYTIEYAYPAPGSYTISYSESHRNAEVKNISSSVDTPLYFETEIIIDPFLGNNNSPAIGTFHYGKVLIGQKMLYNPTFVDENGDSLSYHQSIPMQSKDSQVNGYQQLDDPAFYSGNFNSANEANDGVPTFSISPFDGNLEWDSPRLPGEYTIALTVKEWRTVNNELYNISSTTYDMQIITEENNENIIRPTIILPNSQCYDSNLNETFEAKSNNQLIRVEIFSDAPNAKVNNIPYSEYQNIDEFSKDDFSVDFTLDLNQANQKYHQVVLKVSQKTATGKVYSWSQGFTFGFGCETIERVITSIEPDRKNDISIHYQSGHLVIESNKNLNQAVILNIYDTSGNSMLVSNKEFYNGRTLLKLPHLSHGLYVLAVRSKNMTVRKKFLIH